MSRTSQAIKDSLANDFDRSDWQAEVIKLLEKIEENTRKV